jgi:predicted dehydrogenase
MNVLIIGLGSIGKKHVQALRALDHSIRITALRSHALSQEMEGVQSVSSVNQVDISSIDFAIVANPTHLHAQSVTLLMESNVPMFIEKPLFHSLEFDALVQRLEERRLCTYVACNLRFLESIQFVKDSLPDKRINEVNVYCGSYLPDWRPGQDYRETYSAKADCGGGVHLDLIHELDYVCWLFGFPLASKRFSSSTSSLALASEDYANYLLNYDSFSVNIVLNYFRRDAKRTLEIVCDEGTYAIDLLHNTVHYNGQTVFSSSQRIADTYTTQMRYFIEQLTTETIPMNQAGEAYQILKLCLKED